MRDYIVARFFPEFYAYRRKYLYLQQRVDEAKTWLGSEFPDAAQALRWVQAADYYYWNSGTNAFSAVEDKPWIHSISELREHMRAAKAASK